MDVQLRSLQRIATISNAAEDWHRYCCALERLWGIDSAEQINAAPLDALIARAGYEQSFAKETEELRQKECEKLIGMVIEKMVKYEAAYFDFALPPAIKDEFSQIPTDYPTVDAVGDIYRIVLNDGLLSIAALKDDGKTGYAYSQRAGHTKGDPRGDKERFYCVLQALVRQYI